MGPSGSKLFSAGNFLGKIKIELKMIKLLLVIICLNFFSCSSMNQEECINADWAQIGERDARNGVNSNYYFERAKACSKHSVHADSSSYKRGYAEGLKVYCTSENGYNVGVSGTGYANICPAELSKGFMQGYLAGKTIYEGKKLYEEHVKRQEEDNQRRIMQRERQIRNSQHRACTWGPDCRIEDSCVEDKCSLTGKTCTFSSDCQIEGNCQNNKCTY